MNTDSYNNFSNSFNSYGNPKARRNSAYSMKSNSSKNSKKTTNIKQRKKSFSKLGKNDYSKKGKNLSKFSEVKKSIYCSFCGNLITKNYLEISCHHILCSNCISIQILKQGLEDIQSKIIEGKLGIDCPCNSGKTEILIDELITLLLIDEDCLNHGEYTTCSKCSSWTSSLCQIKICEIHRNMVSDKNVFESIIKYYCLDCHKELCSLCINAGHNGHNIKPLENIVKEIQDTKRKNKNYQEFYDFINLIEKNFFQKYEHELEINISKINEAIKLLNQIKNNFEEEMSQKLILSKNIFRLIKYIYYYYYKNLATVKNNIRIIDFLSQNKYDLQNITFNSKDDFSLKISKLYDEIQNIRIETYDYQINIKGYFSNCFSEKQKAHNGYIFDLLNLNNKYLLSAGEDRKIKIWSLDSMNFLAGLEIDDVCHDSPVFSLCLDSTKKKFFSGSYGEIKIWSTEDFNLINTLYGHNDYITHLEIIKKKINNYISNAKKDFLCSCSHDKTIKIWDYDSFVCVCTLEGHKDKINYFIQNGDGFIISCSSDKSIKFWNIEEEKCYNSLDDAHDNPIYCLAKTEDGKIVASSFSKIKIFDLENNKVDTIYSENNKGVYKLLILPGNKLISSSFKYINFWDLNKYTFIYSLEAHNNYITCLLILNDNLITASDDGDIKIWD